MDTLKKGLEQEENGKFIQGLAYSIAWIIQYHDEPSIAMEMLQYSGYTYADLQKAGCDSHDLKPIAKELGLRLDGKPLKRRETK